jgi:hypothetical protein
MHVGVRWLLCVMAFVAVPAIGSAQEVGQVGITMGYPDSIGVLWHVTQKVAIRPEFSFSHATSDTNLPSAQTSVSSTGVAIGASALFYMNERDHLRPYIAPRWTYSHSDSDTGTTTTTHTISGLFGAQYALGSHFAVFGETGLTYGHSSAKTDVAIATVTGSGNSIGTRTGAGVIFYF